MTHYLIYDPLGYDYTSFILATGTENKLKLYDWFTDPEDAFSNFDTSSWTMSEFLSNNDSPDFIILTTFPSKPSVQQLADYISAHPELLL